MSRSRTIWLAMLVLALLPLGYGLGSVGLLEPEETRYAEMGREMVASGDWLVPTLREFPYLEKPPLSTWLVASSFLLFGRSDFSARLPSLLGALITLGFTLALARRLAGARAAMLAVVVLATSPLLFGMARLVSTDAPFLAALAAGSHALLALRAGGSRWSAFGLGLAAAAAMLIKGPLGVLLLFLLAVALALCERDWRTVLRCAPPVAIATFTAAAVPWFVAVTLRHPEFPGFFFGKHHFERFFASEEVKDLHSGPIHYYLPVLIAGFLPWICFTPIAVRHAWSDADGAGPRAPVERQALWIWAALTLLFFSLGSGKRVPYLLPIWPALAIGVAIALEPRIDAPGRGLLASWLPFGAVALVACAPFTIHASFAPYLEAIGWVRFVLPAVLMIGFLAAAWLFSRARVMPALMTITALLAATLVLAAIALQRLEPSLSMKAAVTHADDLAAPDRALIAYFRYRPGVSYYSHRPVLVVGAPHELDFGMSLRPDQPSPVIDDRFEALLSRPGSMVVVGSTDKLEKRIEEWRLGGARLKLETFGEWSVVSN